MPTSTPGCRTPRVPDIEDCLRIRRLDTIRAAGREGGDTETRVRDSANTGKRGVSPGRSFVGRGRELDELLTELGEASSGRGRLILVSGEPGIGKTRLAEEVAGHARAAGTLVVWGRCWEGDGAPAFWPWVQVIRSLSESVTPAELATHLGAGAAYVAGVVPELAEKLPSAPRAPASPESEHARFYLFDAVTTFLRKISGQRPLLVVLDDLHWADRSTLLLFEFVAKELNDAHILALGTYREGEVRSDVSVAEVVGGLSRAARSIPLRGLTEPEVGLLMERTCGRKPDARLVAAVHKSTGGNPFFVDETVRLLAAEGMMENPPGERLPIPEGVRAAIRRRISRLPREARELLSIGSVIGRELDVALLERASGRGASELLGALATASDVGLLSRPPGRPGTYAFAHAVIRETLYDGVSPPERMRLHLRIGEALEDLHAADLDARVAELAHHFFQAAPAGAVEKALDYARRAGAQALGLLAYEEATGHFERALRIADRYGTGDRAVRFELRLALGEAQKRAGKREAARASFGAAAEAAKASGSALDLARAALGYPWSAAGIGKPPEPPNEMLLDWCRRALASMPAEQTALRAQLLARMAGELDLSPRSAEYLELSAEAVRLARAAGDRKVLGSVLVTRHLLRQGPGTVAERLEIADEILRIAEETGNRDLRIVGHYSRTIALFELGDRPAIDREIAAVARLGEDLREPRYRPIAALYRAARALVSGDFTAGEKLAREALALAEAAEEANFAMIFRLQMLNPWRERGELGELGEFAIAVRRWAEENPSFRAWRYILVWLLTEIGHEAEARRELEAIDPREFAHLPRDLTWLLVTAMLAEAATRLTDRPRARAIYDLLLPFAALQVTVFCSFAMFGTVAHYLGLVESSLGRYDDAERHFEDAIARSAEAGARPWVARSRTYYAEMLLRRASAGDREKASRLLDEALETADELGMKRLVQEALALKLQVQDIARADLESSSDAVVPGANAFLREGQIWTLRFQGRLVRLKDSRGLHLIAWLLRHPGREFHAIELASVSSPSSDDGRVEIGVREIAEEGLATTRLDGSDEVLDARARSEYRQRIADLETELEEARRFRDQGRIERLRTELDTLSETLSAALGLGRRPKSTSPAERARVALTKAIRKALRRIAAEDPNLGRHFERTIRTGRFFSYDPGEGEGGWIL